MPLVLVVCTANMCRSPMAEGLLTQLAPQQAVNSAGTHATGQSAASEAISVLADRGVDISSHVPRQRSVS